MLPEEGDLLCRFESVFCLLPQIGQRPHMILFRCAGTHDMEIYESQQAVIIGGNLVLTIAKAEAGHSVPTPADFVDGVPPPLYGYWNRKTNPDVIAPNETSFTSGMVTSWNKFCFTGGYIEAAITFPGDAKNPGFWPAFWLMGNLARCVQVLCI